MTSPRVARRRAQAQRGDPTAPAVPEALLLAAAHKADTMD
jgi:hypothetical protein